MPAAAKSSDHVGEDGADVRILVTQVEVDALGPDHTEAAMIAPSSTCRGALASTCQSLKVPGFALIGVDGPSGAGRVRHAHSPTCGQRENPAPPEPAQTRVLECGNHGHPHRGPPHPSSDRPRHPASAGLSHLVAVPGRPALGGSDQDTTPAQPARPLVPRAQAPPAVRSAPASAQLRLSPHPGSWHEVLRHRPASRVKW